MNHTSTHRAFLEHSGRALHEPESFRHRFAHLLSGLGHSLLATLFVMGLPALALAVIEGVSRLFGR